MASPLSVGFPTFPASTAFPYRLGAGTRPSFPRSGEMGEKDGRYFASREQSERAMSREAPDGNAAAAHAEMADRYEALAAVFGAKQLTEIPMDYPRGDAPSSPSDED